MHRAQHLPRVGDREERDAARDLGPPLQLGFELNPISLLSFGYIIDFESMVHNSNFRFADNSFGGEFGLRHIRSHVALVNLK